MKNYLIYSNLEVKTNVEKLFGKSISNVEKKTVVQQLTQLKYYQQRYKQLFNR